MGSKQQQDAMWRLVPLLMSLLFLSLSSCMSLTLGQHKAAMVPAVNANASYTPSAAELEATEADDEDDNKEMTEEEFQAWKKRYEAREEAKLQAVLKRAHDKVAPGMAGIGGL